MVDAIDPARLDSLPADVRAAFEALAETSFQLDIERKARLHLQAEKSDLEAKNSDLAAENDFLKEANARLEHLVHELRRARFGPRSEKLDPDQQQLVFEDIEIAIAEVQESIGYPAGAADETADETNVKHPQRRSRALPKELPRVEQVIEPASIACPCACGTMVKIGEDRSERLDVTPAQLRVIVTIRPRYACPKGRAGVTQAPAPAHLIEAGLPTEALIAQVIVSKYSEHLPLYRQAQVFARHGVGIERSTLADWVGRAAFHLAPIVERMAESLKRSGKLFMDETTAPVLDPGRGKTKTGYLWALARDDRPFGGADPPGVATRPGAAACMPKRCSSALTAYCRSMALPATIGCKGPTAGAALRCGSPIVGATAGAKSSRQSRKLARPSATRSCSALPVSTRSRSKFGAVPPNNAAPSANNAPNRWSPTSKSSSAPSASGCRPNPIWARRSPTLPTTGTGSASISTMVGSKWTPTQSKI